MHFVSDSITDNPNMRSSRGATQELIESSTYKHNYNHTVRDNVTNGERDKCTICLTHLEIDDDAR